eukprot:CAMPEP_0117040622 /NCGR_PEP_ID=MMETSP0472-20121206/28411_1 /TAXON_ID=693140 ORGANISM="Tiarina fusus, Strain LIS" /NCGR_SAMPLE_ID=MMETSP0472 /ASSEMBLY_ACC=CAM_ASM_000603 /LENGTH=144 /DNA_ID=CAMNT_0004751393 /DNA_START=110 /DNA_END=541 /DNA_ORIENTATION=+
MRRSILCITFVTLQSLWLNEAFLPLALPQRLASTTKMMMVSTSAPPDTSNNLSSDDDGDDDEGKEETKKKYPSFNPSTKPVRRYKSHKKEPLIAIIGRPNVGKSALVNRICATQSGGAIVADESGITRDRTYRSANFLGENFQV